MKIPVKDMTKKNKVSGRSTIPFKKWWQSEPNDVHHNIWEMVRLIQENHKQEHLQNVRHAYLYNNRHSAYLPQLVSAQSNLPERFHVTYNVVKSATDTVTAKIAQKKLRPRVLTEKGNYAKQQRAKKLTKYLDGVLTEGNVYRMGPEILKEACVFGMGVMKVIPDTEEGKVCFERVLISEILVDDVEARYGEPQTLYQVRLVSKEVLKEQFPEQALEIDRATDGQALNNTNQNSVEMVKVIEGWHLGGEGRHVMAIDTCTLVDEGWEHKCFPFAFLRYQNRIDSFYGQGIAEELLGTQLEINKLLRDIQEAQHLIAQPKILVQRGSNISSSHFNNRPGAIIKYDTNKPDFITPASMNSEIYNHVKWLIQSGYEKVGVSVLSATSQKPTGLDSRPALREFANIESERFGITEMHYQDFFSDIAKLAVKWASVLYQNGVDVKIKAEDKNFIESINWSDVDLDADSFTTKVYISSFLPLNPTARLQKVEEYVRAGWMDRETALQQFDHPDTDAWSTLETADKEYTESIIYGILDKGEYSAPEPEMQLDKAVNLARKAYLEARRNGAPEENTELLLRWIDAAASMMPEIVAPVTPEQGPTQATAQPLPESGIIPQV